MINIYNPSNRNNDNNNLVITIIMLINITNNNSSYKSNHIELIIFECTKLQVCL